MGAPHISSEGLRAMAVAIGLDPADDRVEALLPNVRALIEAGAQVEKLDLKDTPPAFVFEPSEE